jgi:hypothetical protein
MSSTRINVKLLVAKIGSPFDHSLMECLMFRRSRAARDQAHRAHGQLVAARV